jgi:EXPERA (EXPanded EBP superfamily)
MNRQIIPLSKRPRDMAIIAFFLINILFITYIVDLEQLVIADPAHFTYPLWPPPIAVDVIHWWGRTFDPVLLARPAWWKVTIWIDALFFGPFYIVAIYAYIKDDCTPEKIGEYWTSTRVCTSSRRCRGA